MSRVEADGSLSAILNAQTGIKNNLKGIDYAEVLEFGSNDVLNSLIERVLNTIDDCIASCFCSNYFVYSLTVSRTLPSRNSRRSFLWHCDRGPRQFIKILLYLNEGHGGNTEFLDRTTSEQFEQIGYTFGPNKRRQADLSGLALRHGIPYSPIRWPMEAGDALIFEPSRVLHRGVMPNIKERYVLSVVLLPSPRPWHEVFKSFKPVDDAVFPERADQLLKTMSQ